MTASFSVFWAKIEPMKITTWNVNGLRAALGKGLFESLQTIQPDMLCLQEVRAAPAQIDPNHRQRLEQTFPHASWNPAARPGYSGVATLARQQPEQVILGMNAPVFDSEGRVICTRHPEFLLFNIYFPNGGRDLERVPYKLEFYAHLLDHCDALHAAGEQIILCGDFNTSHRPIDLRNAKQNEKNTGFLPEERVWIDRYLEHGFVDIYRQLYPDRVQYTWWTFISNARQRNVGWRLDYFLISDSLVDRVKDVIIHDDTLGSDHCPVSLQL
jgi:exodeoxyribonuclease-3